MIRLWSWLARMDTKKKCIAPGCDSIARLRSAHQADHVFCSAECGIRHSELVQGQITKDDTIYQTMKGYFGSYYHENLNSDVSIHWMCHTLAAALQNEHNAMLQYPLSNASFNALEQALFDKYKNGKEDHVYLFKEVIGSFMNYSHTLKQAREKWQDARVSLSTQNLLLSLFNWMTHPQAQAEFARYLPSGMFEPVILFRGVTGMNIADPYITRPAIDYTSTVVKPFESTLSVSARERIGKDSEGGAIIGWTAYSYRLYGRDTELFDLSFLDKAINSGAKSAIVYQGNEMQTLNLNELRESAKDGTAYNPRYSKW